MSGFSFALQRTKEFGRWYSEQDGRDRLRLDARIQAMILGEFVDSKSLSDGLFELRWRSGMRVYFSRKRVANIDIFVLWGGFKGTQNTDIAKARVLKMRSEYEAEIEAGEKNEDAS